MEDLVEQEQERARAPREVDELPDPGDLGVEPRPARLERVLDPERRPDGEHRDPEPPRPDRRPGEGEHRVDADRPQQRALARHVRPADEQHPQLAAEPEVVADARGLGDQRVADAPRPSKQVSSSLDLGERVGGVLVGVGGERAEGLELARRRRASRRSPGPVRTRQASIGQGELGRPEQERRERGEELVLAGVEQVQEPGQPRDPPRGRLALGLERLAEPRQRRRRGTARASSRASRPESRTRSCARRSIACEDAADPRPSAGRRTPNSTRITRKNGIGPTSVAAQATSDGDGQHREHGRRDDRGRDREDPAAAAPGGERLGVDPLADVGPEQVEVFAEVEPRAQLVDGRLPVADRRRVGRARAARRPASPRRPGSAPCRGARRASRVPNRSRSAA